jgi:hypothetical protein
MKFRYNEEYPNPKNTILHQAQKYIISKIHIPVPDTCTEGLKPTKLTVIRSDTPFNFTQPERRRSTVNTGQLKVIRTHQKLSLKSLLLLILLCSLGLFLPDPNQPLVHPLLAQFIESLLSLHLISDRYDLCSGSGLHNWQDWSIQLGHARQLFGACVSGLRNRH